MHVTSLYNGNKKNKNALSVLQLTVLTVIFRQQKYFVIPSILLKLITIIFYLFRKIVKDWIKFQSNLSPSSISNTYHISMQAYLNFPKYEELSNTIALVY